MRSSKATIAQSWSEWNKSLITGRRKRGALLRDEEIGGTASADVIDAGDGDDVVESGKGADDVDGDAGNDSIEAGAGDDSVDGGKGNDTVDGGSGDDSLNGGSGDDLITADIGDDQLEGGKGDDTLEGGKGRDILDGGLGNDILEGGKGADDFVLSDGIDRIKDFNPEEGDRLVWKPSTFPLEEEPKLIQKGQDVVVKAKGKAKTIIENIKLSQVELYVDTERPEWSFKTKDPVKDIYTDDEGNKRQRFTFSFTPQGEYKYSDGWYRSGQGQLAGYQYYFYGKTDLIRPEENYHLEDDSTKPEFWKKSGSDRRTPSEFWENYEIVPVNKEIIDTEIKQLNDNIIYGDDELKKSAQKALNALEEKQIFRYSPFALEGKDFYFMGGDQNDLDMPLSSYTDIRGSENITAGDITEFNHKHVISISPKTKQTTGNISLKMVVLDYSKTMLRTFESEELLIEVGCVDFNQKIKSPNYYIIESDGTNEASKFSAVFEQEDNGEKGLIEIPVCGSQDFAGTKLNDSITGSDQDDVINSFAVSYTHLTLPTKA